MLQIGSFNEKRGAVVDGDGSALPDVVAACGLPVLEVAHHKGHQVRGHLIGKKISNQEDKHISHNYPENRWSESRHMAN